MEIDVGEQPEFSHEGSKAQTENRLRSSCPGVFVAETINRKSSIDNRNWQMATVWRVPRLHSGRLCAHGFAGVLGQYDGNNNLLRKYIYGPGKWGMFS
jgi:hypothetical protein